MGLYVFTKDRSSRNEKLVLLCHIYVSYDLYSILPWWI